MGRSSLFFHEDDWRVSSLLLLGTPILHAFFSNLKGLCLRVIFIPAVLFGNQIGRLQKQAQKIQRMQNSTLTKCQILIKSRISCSKAATVYQQAVHSVPTQSFFFCQSTLARARNRGPETEMHTPSTPTKDEVTFGHITRNMVFRTKVAGRLCSNLQCAQSHIISGHHNLGWRERKKLAMRSNQILSGFYHRHWMKYYQHFKDEKLRFNQIAHGPRVR